MNEQPFFEMTQKLTIRRPRSGDAYAIPCNEWATLKDRISKLSSEPKGVQSFGFLFLGAFLSTAISVFTGKIEGNAASWAILVVTAFAGGCCLFVAGMQRATRKERAGDVLAQMELIEQRFEAGT